MQQTTFGSDCRRGEYLDLELFVGHFERGRCGSARFLSSCQEVCWFKKCFYNTETEDR
jgi:hypothetical protein